MAIVLDCLSAAVEHPRKEVRSQLPSDEVQAVGTDGGWRQTNGGGPVHRQWKREADERMDHHAVRPRLLRLMPNGGRDTDEPAAR
ncbi:unnamed protein product [Linum trigynum]|uniref:Uncharacterized protein n=1 Tax=Linum trigynum TaxID=586398 RepID=A0AAV2FXJ4_9ROSI